MHFTVFYCIVLYCIVLYCILLYCIVCVPLTWHLRNSVSYYKPQDAYFCLFSILFSPDNDGDGFVDEDCAASMKMLFAFSWLVGWLVGWLAGWLVCWLVCWLVGCLAGVLVGWLVGWMNGWPIRLLGQPIAYHLISKECNVLWTKKKSWNLIEYLVDWLASWLIDCILGWLLLLTSSLQSGSICSSHNLPNWPQGSFRWYMCLSNDYSFPQNQIWVSLSTPQWLPGLTEGQRMRLTSR